MRDEDQHTHDDGRHRGYQHRSGGNIFRQFGQDVILLQDKVYGYFHDRIHGFSDDHESYGQNYHSPLHWRKVKDKSHYPNQAGDGKVNAGIALSTQDVLEPSESVAETI